jgi:cell division protein FtsQ
MTRSRSIDDHSMPPVMVRGGSQSLPLPARKPSKKVRRRFDVELGSGAELRLPALPQVRAGWRLLSGILVLVLGGLLYQLWNSPGFRVDGIEVNGLQRLTSTDVNAVLDIQGEPIFLMNAAGIRKQLEEAFPEFSSVRVVIALRNKVTVTVEERLPILTWRQDGRTILVDAQGFAFPQREGAPDGPSLTVEAASSPPGAEASLDSLPEQATALELAGLTSSLSDLGSGETQDLEKSVPEARAPFLPAEMVSAILSMSGQAPRGAALVYDEQHGLGYRDSQGWAIYFGDVSDMGMKLNVYKALVSRLHQEGIQPVLISVENVHAPYYRVEQ